MDVSIQTQLRSAGAVMQKERGKVFVLRLFQWLPFAVAAVFLADVIFHFGPIVRLGILLSLIAGITAVLIGGLIVVPRRRNPLLRIARELEKRDEGLGSKPVNLVQFQEQIAQWPEGSITRRIGELAIQSYTEELSSTDLSKLARTDAVLRQLKRSLKLVLLGMLLLVAGWPVLRIEIMRLADPFGDHPPYSLTRLEITEPGPEGADVIYGSGLQVKAVCSGHRPGSLFLTFREAGSDGEGKTIPLYQRSDREFSQAIDGIISPLEVYVHTRSGRSKSAKREVRLILTPQLRGASVTIEPPAYTGEKVQTKPLRFKTVKALKGSRITFSLDSNRPLSGGYLEVIRTGEDSQRFPMRVTGTNTVAYTLQADQSCRLRFSMIDETGILSTELWEETLNVIHDLPPGISIAKPGRQSIASMNYEMKADLQVNDDYGLTTTRLYAGTNGVYGPPLKWEWPAAANRKSAELSKSFKLSDLGVKPGDMLAFYAEAIDNAPEPNISMTEVSRVLVVTEDAYNDLLRRQRDMRDVLAKYMDLVGRLQEQIEDQKKIKAELEEIEKELEDPAMDERKAGALRRKFRSLREKQEGINKTLAKLADEMESFVRDNPLYDVESEFAKYLKDYAGKLRESVQESSMAMDQMSSAVPGSESAPPAPGDVAAMKKAAEEQLKKLGAVDDRAKPEILDRLQDIAELHEVVKDFTQFKQLYDQQKGLVEQLEVYSRKDVLLREDQLAMKELAGEQREVGLKLDVLAAKLDEHAEKAERLFPKAAQSARDLSQAIRDFRLPSRCEAATAKMLSGRGPASHALAQGIEQDMLSLFSGACSGGGSCASNELDQYLKLVLGAPPGQTYEQMAQCLKFGWGMTPSPSFGMSGSGVGGMTGFSTQTGPSPDLLGGESSILSSQAQSQAGDGTGEAETAERKPVNRFDDPDSVKVETKVVGESDATAGEITVEKYREVIDRYFQKVTSE